MECYRCESSDLVLAPLWPYERKVYQASEIVIRQCINCGLEQNHCGDDEPLSAREASEQARTRDPW